MVWQVVRQMVVIQGLRGLRRIRAHQPIGHLNHMVDTNVGFVEGIILKKDVHISP